MSDPNSPDIHGIPGEFEQWAEKFFGPFWETIWNKYAYEACWKAAFIAGRQSAGY